MMKPVRKFIRNGEDSLPWEEYLGSNPQDRTCATGKSALNYREHILKTNQGTNKNEHEDYIHRLGSHALQIQTHEEITLESSRKIGNKERLIPRRIHVDDDDEEDGVLKSNKSIALSLDQDWSTISWNDEMVASACETLFEKFQEPIFILNEHKRTKAIAMLEKLVQNHLPAEIFIKKNIEHMMNCSTSRLLRGGRSGSIFNFLYVINIGKEKCSQELTTFSFAGKAIEMMLLESKLAVTLIQFTFRSAKLKRQIKQSFMDQQALNAVAVESHGVSKHKNKVSMKSNQFGTDLEMRRLKERPINARSSDLRARWRAVHWNRSALTFDVGIRGPVHIGANYTKLLLEIISYLVSDAVGSHASANRVDVITAYGCLILPVLLSNPFGPFASLVANILSYISKAWESFLPILNCGSVKQCLKYMKHLKVKSKTLIRSNNLAEKDSQIYEPDVSVLSGNTGRSSVPQQNAEDDKFEKFDEKSKDNYQQREDEVSEKVLLSARDSYMKCVEMFLHVTEHAAGMQRTRERVTMKGYMVERVQMKAKKGAIAIDYFMVSQSLEGMKSGPNADLNTSQATAFMLGTEVISELVSSMVETIHVPLLKVIFLIPFLICCIFLQDTCTNYLSLLL
jgi:hypothetical protein